MKIFRFLLCIAVALTLSACAPAQPPADLPAPTATSTTMPTVTPEAVLADCFEYFYLAAWLDTDGNGVWDQGEQPLAGVEFFVAGSYAHSLSQGKAVSAENGEASVDTWSPGGCINLEGYSVQATAPEGYQLTTTSPLPYDPDASPTNPYIFGFQPSSP